jgi:hypothetical protein
LRSMAHALLCGFAALFLIQAPVAAQDAAAPAQPQAATLQTGPAEVARHWSKYDYPGSIPEGAPYVIIRDGDTLWDLAGEYLGSPYLWPQIWEENQYVADAHWIYPGDPLLLPRLQIVADKAGQLGPEGMPEEEEGVAGMPSEYQPGEEAGSLLYPITEENTLTCAGYLTDEDEDDTLRIDGAEEKGKLAFGAREFVYINKGSNSGVRAGDVYTVNAKGKKVKHPETGDGLGRRILTKGTVRVLLVEDDAALAVVEMSCSEIHVGDFLKVYESPNVPLALRQDPPSRLTPHSGKTQGYVVDLIGGLSMAAEGHLVTLDLGTEAGAAPGNLLVAYRKGSRNGEIRHVLGEVAVVAVRERTSTAKIISSVEPLLVGDQVELR